MPTDDSLTEWAELLGPAPEWRACHDACDELLADLSPQQRHQALAELHFDADGRPRWRRQMLHLVR